jgi:protocatechuate 3,4-dioxygenase beta subunit
MVRRVPCRLLCSLLLLAAASPAFTAGARSVSGKVYDSDGRPASAATVYLIVYDRNTFEDRGLLKSRTQPDGSFSFPPPREETQISSLGVLAVKQGYGAWGARIEPEQPRSGLEIRLAPEVTLEGTVRDWEGRPLPKAKVRVGGGQWSGWVSLPEHLDALMTATDAAGRFRLRGLAEEGAVSLEFICTGYARWGKHVRVAERPAIAARLRPAAAITGRVLYEGTRKPAAGVRVSCQQQWPSGAPDHYAGFGRAVTDAQGRFRFDGLWPGRYTVLFSDPEKQKAWAAMERVVESAASGKVALCEEMLLTRGGFVAGKVLDRETGKPVAGAQVGSHRSDRQQWVPGPGTKTAADGTYRLRLPPAKWRVQAEHWQGGYLPPWQERQEPTEVGVAMGKTVSGIDFTLQRGAEVKGIVLDPDGRPDPRAKIWGPHIWEHGVQPDGTFTLKTLRPGGPVTLTVRGSDRALKAEVEVTPRPGASEPVTIRLKRGLAVSGRVVDSRGQPLPNAEARAERRIEMGDGGWTFVAMDTARADAEGRFTLWLLPGIEHQVNATAPGFGGAQQAEVMVRDAGIDVGTLTLAAANLAVAGRVTDAEGKPVSGVQLHAGGEGQPLRGPSETVTDEQGRYRIEGLAAGKLFLSLNHPTYGWDYRDNIDAGATGIDFVLVPEQEPRPKPVLKPGDAAPEIAVARWLTGEADGRLPGAPGLKALRGRVVVLQFAMAHNPAVESCSARLAALQRRYGRDRVAVVAIYDASLSAEETRSYLQTLGVSYPAGIVGSTPQFGWNSPVFRRYGVRAVPSLYLIDPRGRLRAVNPSLPELESQVRRLVSRR